MKHLIHTSIFALFLTLFPFVIHASTSNLHQSSVKYNDFNIVIDFSEVRICDMNEESFAVYEQDWYKDRPYIEQLILENIVFQSSKYITYNKNSANTLYISVISIDKLAIYSCDAVMKDTNGNIIFEKMAIPGRWNYNALRTTLRNFKEGAKWVGYNIGREFKKWLKKQQ